MKPLLLDVLFVWFLLNIVSNCIGEDLDAQWSPWSEWSRCSKMRNGVKLRARACYNNANKEVRDCIGKSEETARCSTCPGGLKMVLKPSLVKQRVGIPQTFTCHYSHDETEPLKLDFSLVTARESKWPKTINFDPQASSLVQKIKNSVQQTNNTCGTIIKWKVQLQPETEYVRCILRDALGVEVGSLRSKIIGVPEVEVYPASQIIPEGAATSFNCRVVTGRPKPKIYWTRADGKPLPASVRQVSNSELRFSRVTKTDIGQYICHADNYAGNATATATLDLQIQINPKITYFPGDKYQASLGERIRLMCHSAGAPEPSVTWFKDGATPASGNETLLSAVLEIDSVRKEDEGAYHCVASNWLAAASRTLQLVVQDTQGSNEIHGNTRIQERVDTSDIVHRLPVIQLLPSSRQIVKPGKDATITCSVPGNEQRLEIQWRAFSGTMSPRARSRREKLWIGGVQIEDQGRYICKVKSDAGEVEATAEIIVADVEATRDTTLTSNTTKVSINATNKEHQHRVVLTTEKPEVVGNHIPKIKYYNVTADVEATRDTTHTSSTTKVSINASTNEDQHKVVLTTEKPEIVGDHHIPKIKYYNLTADVEATRDTTYTSSTTKVSIYASNEEHQYRDILTTEKPEVIVDDRIPKIKYFNLTSDVEVTRDKTPTSSTTKVSIYASDEEQPEVILDDRIPKIKYFNLTDKVCRPDQYQCTNKQCIWKGGHCDGVKDCTDNSDEIKCPTLPPNSRCWPNEFQCTSGPILCINILFKCDGEPDCIDRSDENDCGKQEITNS